MPLLKFQPLYYAKFNFYTLPFSEEYILIQHQQVLPEHEPLYGETKANSKYPSNVYDFLLAGGENKNS